MLHGPTVPTIRPSFTMPPSVGSHDYDSSPQHHSGGGSGGCFVKGHSSLAQSRLAFIRNYLCCCWAQRFSSSVASARRVGPKGNAPVSSFASNHRAYGGCLPSRTAFPLFLAFLVLFAVALMASSSLITPTTKNTAVHVSGVPPSSPLVDPASTASEEGYTYIYAWPRRFLAAVADGIGGATEDSSNKLQTVIDTEGAASDGDGGLSVAVRSKLVPAALIAEDETHRSEFVAALRAEAAASAKRAARGGGIWGWGAASTTEGDENGASAPSSSNSPRRYQRSKLPLRRYVINATAEPLRAQWARRAYFASPLESLLPEGGKTDVKGAGIGVKGVAGDGDESLPIAPPPPPAAAERVIPNAIPFPTPASFSSVSSAVPIPIPYIDLPFAVQSRPLLYPSYKQRFDKFNKIVESYSDNVCQVATEKQWEEPNEYAPDYEYDDLAADEGDADVPKKKHLLTRTILPRCPVYAGDAAAQLVLAEGGTFGLPPPLPPLPTPTRTRKSPPRKAAAGDSTAFVSSSGDNSSDGDGDGEKEAEANNEDDDSRRFNTDLNVVPHVAVFHDTTRPQRRASASASPPLACEASPRDSSSWPMLRPPLLEQLVLKVLRLVLRNTGCDDLIHVQPPPQEKVDEEEREREERLGKGQMKGKAVDRGGGLPIGTAEEEFFTAIRDDHRHELSILSFGAACGHAEQIIAKLLAGSGRINVMGLDHRGEGIRYAKGVHMGAGAAHQRLVWGSDGDGGGGGQGGGGGLPPLHASFSAAALSLSEFQPSSLHYCHVRPLVRRRMRSTTATATHDEKEGGAARRGEGKKGMGAANTKKAKGSTKLASDYDLEGISFAALDFIPSHTFNAVLAFDGLLAAVPPPLLCAAVRELLRVTKIGGSVWVGHEADPSRVRALAECRVPLCEGFVVQRSIIRESLYFEKMAPHGLPPGHAAGLGRSFLWRKESNTFFADVAALERSGGRAARRKGGSTANSAGSRGSPDADADSAASTSSASSSAGNGGARALVGDRDALLMRMGGG